MILKTLSSWFWNPYLWLRPGLTWDDISKSKINYPDPNDLFYQILFAIAITLIRAVVESLLLVPLGQFLGLNKHKPVGPFIVSDTVVEVALEETYKKCGNKIGSVEMIELSKKTHLDSRQIQRWIRRRKNRDRPSVLVKFTESGWRCLGYSCLFIIGCSALWSKTWSWDIVQLTKDLPYHDLTDDVWWYYILVASFNWSLLITLAFDVKRKDFWEMFLHHIITITLYNVGWISNLIRGTALISFIHDSPDIVLEFGKMVNYTKYTNSRIKNTIFLIFVIVWIAARLVLFPIILYRSSTEGAKITIPFPAFYFQASMACIIMMLDVFWTYLIFKVILKKLRSKKFTDVRSETESGSDDDNPLSALHSDLKAKKS